MNREESKSNRGEAETQSAQKRSMSVFLYILLLFSAALLLMGLSSLIHQRNNTEALGKLQNSVSAMQEVQNLQEKIIDLQEAQRELKEELQTAREAQSEADAARETERVRTQTMERLYVIEMLYRSGRYQACQAAIDRFAADGLVRNLSTEPLEYDVISPLDCYRQLQDATAARLAEAEAANASPLAPEDAGE